MIRRLRGTRATAIVNSTLAEVEPSSLFLLLTATTTSRRAGSRLPTIFAAEDFGFMGLVNAFFRMKDDVMKNLKPPRIRFCK